MMELLRKVAGLARQPSFRNNVSCWKEMQEAGYFENCPDYKGLPDLGEIDVRAIEQFIPLQPHMAVVVIGCGYGRETLHIGARVKQVYGIDVSERILSKATQHLRERGVTNFTPVLAERFKSDIPDGIDLVFSNAVMQHLTRDLVADYFKSLGQKLTPGGRMVVQFLDEVGSDHNADAELRVYEPSVSWTPQQILTLARSAELRLEEIRIAEHALWHWAHTSRPASDR